MLLVPDLVDLVQPPLGLAAKNDVSASRVKRTTGVTSVQWEETPTLMRSELDRSSGCLSQAV